MIPTPTIIGGATMPQVAGSEPDGERRVVTKQLLPGGMYNTMLGQGVLMQVVTVFSVGVGALLSLAIWWYVWSLWRRGVLK